MEKFLRSTEIAVGIEKVLDVSFHKSISAQEKKGVITDLKPVMQHLIKECNFKLLGKTKAITF